MLFIFKLRPTALKVDLIWRKLLLDGGCVRCTFIKSEQRLLFYADPAAKFNF